MKKIIAAVDFSNATPGVIEMACKLAKPFSAEIHLFHVVEPEPSYTAYGFTPDEFPAMHTFHEEARRRAGRKLGELLATVNSDVPTALTHLAEGSPLHSLLDYVRQTKPDLVVLGTHGHGLVASLLLGSVAEGMVRKATAPTLIVPVADKE